MNFTQLSAFYAVAEEGSVGRGAERLMVSQPAVSKQIKQLERSLDVKLFERTPKGVRPTRAGELLADYARRIFSLADEARQAVDDLQGLRRGSLSIGASPTLATYFLPDVLVRFRRRFPAIGLRLEIEKGEALQQRLMDGAIEFGLSEVASQYPQVEQKTFMHDRLIAIAPRRHPLARKRTVSLRGLLEFPFIVREAGSGTKSLVEKALAARGLDVRPTLSLSSTEAIKRAVSAGMGVAIVSEMAAGSDIAGRKLAALNVQGLPIQRPIYHLRVMRRGESKAAQAFMCLVAQAAREITSSPAFAAGVRRR